MDLLNRETLYESLGATSLRVKEDIFSSLQKMLLKKISLNRVESKQIANRLTSGAPCYKPEFQEYYNKLIMDKYSRPVCEDNIGINQNSIKNILKSASEYKSFANLSTASLGKDQQESWLITHVREGKYQINKSNDFVAMLVGSTKDNSFERHLKLGELLNFKTSNFYAFEREAETYFHLRQYAGHLGFPISHIRHGDIFDELLELKYRRFKLVDLDACSALGILEENIATKWLRQGFKPYYISCTFTNRRAFNRYKHISYDKDLNIRISKVLSFFKIDKTYKLSSVLSYRSSTTMCSYLLERKED